MISTKQPPQLPTGPVKSSQRPTDAYSFAAEPQTMAQPRKNYHEDADAKSHQKANIMYDRRIHRGNTYASPVLPVQAQADPVELQRQQELKRKLRAKQRAEARRRVKTPDAISGRKHIDVQTDLYLEELSDKIPEAIAITQTDAFLNRAPSPIFVAQKSGLDVSTQIYDGDLFDFDMEVIPILEVLVGKTLEQALMEVQEEDELEILRQHQRNFFNIRNAEFIEIQRMEDTEKRRNEEKDRRLQEQRRILGEKQEATEIIAARGFAQSYLQNLLPSVYDSLASNGYFYDKIERELESSTLPWLTAEVNQRMEASSLAERLTDDIILEAIRRYRAGS